MKKKVTIIDIAKECGLSKTTVACALNSEKGQVSKKNTELVLAAAKKLGYAPNMMAKALKSKKTNTVGIILPYPNNYHFGTLTLTLQKRLSQHGYTAMFAFWSDHDEIASQRMEQAVDVFAARRVDAIITCPITGVDFSQTGIPTIFTSPPPVKGFDYVYADHREAALEAAEYLWGQGYRSFAFLMPSLDSPWAEEFLKSLDCCGFKSCHGGIIEGISGRVDAQEAMRVFLQTGERPDLVIGHNDIIALGAMAEAQRYQIKVPDEMGFVGYDNIEEAGCAFPSLTTFSNDIEKTTDHLLDLLFSRIEKGRKDVQIKKLVPKLINRNSTL